MSVKKKLIEESDLYDLAGKILGIPDNEMDDAEIEMGLWEGLGIEICVFEEVVSRLLPLIHTGKSELTGKVYKGFADVKNESWIVKTDATNK